MERDVAIEALIAGLAARVLELRRESGMTQRELADTARWSQSALGKFERGELVPGLDKILGLQYAFRCASLDDLFALPAKPLTGEVLGEARRKDDARSG